MVARARRDRHGCGSRRDGRGSNNGSDAPCNSSPPAAPSSATAVWAAIHALPNGLRSTWVSVGRSERRRPINCTKRPLFSTCPDEPTEQRLCPTRNRVDATMPGVPPPRSERASGFCGGRHRGTDGLRPQPAPSLGQAPAPRSVAAGDSLMRQAITRTQASCRVLIPERSKPRKYIFPGVRRPPRSS